MSLQQLFLVLRSRYRIILGLLLACVAVAGAASLLQEKRYKATSSVVVDVRNPDPIGGIILPASTTPSYMATQLDIVNSDRVAARAAKLLKLDADPVRREAWMEATEGKVPFEAWTAAEMRAGLAAWPAQDSNVINLAFFSPDPAFAAAAANAYARAYIDTNVELRAEPARSYADWFLGQSDALRDRVARAQARLSEYQQKVGILVTDERLDSETGKLADLTSQLAIAEGETATALSKQQSGRLGEILPDVAQNGLIQNLKTDIARLEAKLEDASSNLGRNHPQFQRMSAELASLRKRLETETQNIVSGFSAARGIGADKAGHLKAMIAAQKQKLLELKRLRDEAAVLLAEVSAAQKAYDMVSQRFAQSNLESKVTQTNVSVLTPAIEPLEPFEPRPGTYVLMAGGVGLLLGIAAAFGLEMLDRRVRSSEDLERAFGGTLPLVVEFDRPRLPARRPRLGGPRRPALSSFPG